jgi:hypothetical protein
MTNNFLRALGLAVVAGATLFVPRRNAVANVRTAPNACMSDSSFQRLAFWIGDWDVFDSTGTRYASQRVRAVVDDCALTAEWTGPVGDKGMSMTAYDPRTGDWKQVYVTNQVPGTAGVSIRKSDPSYDGPGIRFIPLADPAPGQGTRLRITITPLPNHRARQTFEESRDSGKTWHTVFNAEHRPH